MSASTQARLLIVDDIPTMLRTLKYALEQHGYEVVAEAMNGEEALTVLAREPVDLILSDWHMPGMDGLELLRRVRNTPTTASLPFLMVTGEIERAKVAEAIKAGVTDFIAKPITPEALDHRVQRSLRSARGRIPAHVGAAVLSAASPASQPSESKPQPTDRQRIILTVDDERDNIEIVAATLKPEYSVKAAINGRVALKAAAARPPPDLILLDIMMPEMDGLEVLKQLKGDLATAAIPVIFVTAKGTGEEIADGLAAGAEDYIVKPIQPLVLKARIANQLRLKDAADRLRDQLDLMVEHVRLKEDVDRMVRHDIRTPLSGIIGYAEELGDQGFLSKRQHDLLEKIEQAAFTVSEIVNFSLELLRIERGEYQPSRARLDLVDLARRVSRDLQPLARTRQVDINLQDQDEQIIASAERLLAYTVLANLLRNAVEASTAGSSVRVRFEHGEAMVKAHVLNDRLVPSAIRERLFEKGATYGKEGGTGLGTYSAKLMAEVQGGSVDFTSSAANGTCFTFTLPSYQDT